MNCEAQMLGIGDPCDSSSAEQLVGDLCLTRTERAVDPDDRPRTVPSGRR